jgi:glycosyltransferase involved in cell wall biosynthesis
MAFVRPSRDARSPWVQAAMESASNLGYRPYPIEKIEEKLDPSTVMTHLFPASFEDMLNSVAGLPDGAGPVIIDIPLPPYGLVRLPGSERAEIERRQLGNLPAGALVTRSRAAAELLTGHGIASHLVAADCARPASADEIATARLEFGVAPAGRSLACISDLERDSGVDQALEAAAMLLADDAFDQLVMIGEGDKSARFARHAAALGMSDRVSFIGMAAPHRWSALLASFAAIVFPGENAAVLGSDMPQLMALASQLPSRVAGTETAWRSQPAAPDESAHLHGSASDWSARLRTLLEQEPEICSVSDRPDRLTEIYQTLAPAG